MITQPLNNIFKSGSRTYFYSSLFFPANIRKDVTTLYAFVRIADNYVDKLPQDKAGFDNFWKEFWRSIDKCDSDNPVICSFCELVNKHSFDHKWIKAFEHSMRSDFHPPIYKTLEQTLEYIHGSAEVIGLMMAKILNVPAEGSVAASMLGRSMQYANFIRDINEDLILDRCYFPQEFLNKFHLSSLSQTETKSKPDQFVKFINYQCNLYFDWQYIAETGYKFLPSNTLKAVKTSADMYKWTIAQIQNDPFIVYKKKVKPSILRILTTSLFN